MDMKESLNKLNDILEEATQYDDAVSYVTSNDSEAFKIAIKALKKQIPQKPCERIITKYDSSGELKETTNNFCPECGYLIHKYAKRNDYCHHCGVAIDWKGYND